MRNLKVSVVVAVYNGAETLPRCLDSLVSQTYQNVEIICVNDCSPDNSLEILEDYATRYPNMRIINHDENKNGGGADNTGIRAAKGEYVCIVDQDDSLPCNSIESLLQNSHDGEDDIVIGTRYNIDDNGNKIKRYNGVVGNDIHANVEFVFNNDIRILGGLFKKCLFTDNNLFYPEKVGWADNAIYNAIYISAKSISVIDDVIYNYYVSTPNSLSKIISMQGIKDRIYTTNLYYENCIRIDKQKLYTDCIKSYYLKLTVYTIELLGFYPYNANKDIIASLSKRVSELWSDEYKEKFTDLEMSMLLDIEEYIKQRERERRKDKLLGYIHSIRHYVAQHLKSIIGIKN